jgi:prepilin-type processing-associated H-X9-DG protein
VVQLGADGEAELVGGGYGWGVMLLPFLEQDNLYDATNFKQFRADFPSGGSVADSANWTVYHAKVSAFLCPSDPADRLITLHDDSGAALGTVARGNYVGNFGQGEAAEDEGREGIFYRNSSIRISDVVDGASKTFLVGERSSNLGKTTWFGLFLEAVVRSSFGEEESPVLVLGHTGYYPEVHTPNDPLAHVDDYWSFHGTGAHFLMVDGSVHMIDNSIDARVYAALASRDGYETVGDGDF